MKRKKQKNFYMMIQAVLLLATIVINITSGSFAFADEEEVTGRIKDEINLILKTAVEVSGRRECYIEMPMPNVSGARKTWMSYEKITSVTSKQYRLQQWAWTDPYGFRRYGEHYMIALGSGYNGEIGDIYRITLENGTVFTAALGDIKADKHTDSSNRYVTSNSNIIEFIVDSGILHRDAKYHGDMSYIEGFDSGIAKIEKRIDKDRNVIR